MAPPLGAHGGHRQLPAQGPFCLLFFTLRTPRCPGTHHVPVQILPFLAVPPSLPRKTARPSHGQVQSGRRRGLWQSSHFATSRTTCFSFSKPLKIKAARSKWLSREPEQSFSTAGDREPEGTVGRVWRRFWFSQRGPWVAAGIWGVEVRNDVMGRPLHRAVGSRRSLGFLRTVWGQGH